MKLGGQMDLRKLREHPNLELHQFKSKMKTYARFFGTLLIIISMAMLIFLAYMKFSKQIDENRQINSEQDAQKSTADSTIKVFNTKNVRTIGDTPDTASIETSQGQEISENEDETVDRRAEGDATENAASLVSKESNQHTHRSDKPNDEEISAEELAKKKTEMERQRRELEAYKVRVNEIGATLNELNKHSEIRNKEIANHLNSLSPKEQQAYFENIRSGKVLEEMAPNFFESARVNMQSRGYSEETIDKVLKDFKQEIQKFASEAGAKRHLEKLRTHGFNPKF